MLRRKFHRHINEATEVENFSTEESIRAYLEKYRSVKKASKWGKLFDEFVPGEDEADTVAGEILRAVCRIQYRYYNDGDMIGTDYGRYTCNAPARYLIAVCRNNSIERQIRTMWGMFDVDEYEKQLDKLKDLIWDYLTDNAELFFKKNNDDMWEWFDDEEDKQWDDDDDDEEWDEDEDDDEDDEEWDEDEEGDEDK